MLTYKLYRIKNLIFLATPLILFISYLFFNINVSDTGVASRLESISITDTSTSQRLELYSSAIDYIYHHPIIGCGLGNWKVESLSYWNKFMEGYMVPYHAHNDFLELSTEIGLFGGLSYLLVFIYLFFWSFLSFIKQRKIHYLIYLCMLFVYFFDANFNFPLERPLSQVNFILLMIFPLINLYTNEKDFS